MLNASIRTVLAGGDRRSIGNAHALAATIADDPHLFDACVQAMSDDDPVVRMRAADAVEKASRSRPALLAPHKAALLGAISKINQHEVRWHLLQLLPRLSSGSSGLSSGCRATAGLWRPKPCPHCSGSHAAMHRCVRKL